MKKVKLETRIENAVNAFFENEQQFENSQLVFDHNSKISPNEKAKSFSEKVEPFVNVFKQIFIFLPSAFFLYFISLMMAYFPLYYVSARMLIAMFIWLLVVSFMAIAGIGSVKELKNLIVPATIISFAAIFATIVSFLPLPRDVKENICFYYSIYLFPIALILAGLAKNWINIKSEDI